MRRILVIVILLVFAFSCQNAEKTSKKTQEEINKENYLKEEGDHVLNASDIPPMTLEEKKAYMEKSKQIAQEAFQIFTSHLQRYFKEKHPVEALEYCKNNALKITDSLAKVHGVEIKRTSYRLRNPENKPTDQEEKIMKIFKQRILKNLKPEPYLHYDVNGNPHVYIPIITQEKCLMCHGDPNKEIPQEINNKLAELYPGDKAIFFKPGDLRGIWSIKFPKKKHQSE